MSMTEEQFNKLPKHAQSEIKNLRYKVARLTEQVSTASVPNAKVKKVSFDPDIPSIGLEDTLYRFNIPPYKELPNQPQHIDVRCTKEGLQLMASSGPLVVKLRVSNHIIVAVEE